MNAYWVSVSQITILSLYLLSAAAFTCSRLPRFDAQSRAYLVIAYVFGIVGTVLHAQQLFELILPGDGFHLSIGNAASMIGLELAAIALIAAVEPTLRGMSAGMLALTAATAVVMSSAVDPTAGAAMAWQVRAHILIALLSYGLLSVGAIVAVFALVQERRLHSARITPVNQLFAPLETTERLLIAVTATGFAGLTLSIASGLSFVNDLLEQEKAEYDLHQNSPDDPGYRRFADFRLL